MDFKVGDRVWYRKRIGFHFSRVVSGTIEKIGKDRATIVGTTKKGEPFKYTTFIRNLNLKKENIMKRNELEQLVENIICKVLVESNKDNLYVIEIRKNGRNFFIVHYEDRYQLSWRKDNAILFPSIENAKEQIKNDRMLELTIGGNYKIIKYSDAKNH